MNGTHINSRRIKEEILSPGELLTVGTITFRAVYEIDRDLGQTQRKPEPTLPPVAVSASQDEGSDSEDRRPTEGVAELKPGASNGEELSTEVSDVDPEEFLEQLREAERKSENS